MTRAFLSLSRRGGASLIPSSANVFAVSSLPSATAIPAKALTTLLRAE